MKLAIVIGLTLVFLALVRRNLLQIDLSFPWFVALVVLGFASLNDTFVDWVASRLGIVYQPIAIVFLTIFIVIGLSTFLAVAISRVQARQTAIVRHMAQLELQLQEDERARSGGS
jgi:hypothetical protein